ncbi:FAD-dependent oxidoreductase [Rhodococcus baikonurensis]
MTDSNRPLRVAIVGAGPAGIYAADALMKSDTAVSGRGVSIDLFERMPAPFGLIRYGVAPDHPRIKGIITALHKVLDKPQVRLLGNIDYGTDITLDDLQSFYDAVIFSTGANADRALGIPGIELDGSYGAADFVSWYDGHPDVPRTWPLEAEKVAVLGVGNVALDIARVLAKTGDELLPTEIPANVYEGLKNNKAVEVHVFGRRGPAQAKFTPLELRELDHSPTIEVIVDPEDIDYDEGSEQARRNSKQVDMVANTLQDWAIRDVGARPHKLFLHFFESPTEILGEDGKVVGLRTERTQLDGTGNVKGTGTYKDWDVQAVYRAVGYLSQNITQLPFDDQAGTVPNDAGRVVADDNAEGAARFMPPPTSPAGSSAAPSASSATPRVTPTKPSRIFSRIPSTSPAPRTPTRTPSSSSSKASRCRTRLGRAGTASTRTSAAWASPKAVSASRSSSVTTC